MGRYALKRLAIAIPTFLFITLVTFLVVNLGPGDPALSASSLGGDALVSAEARARARAQWGLEGPLLVRYGHWLSRCVQLDFGRSLHDGQAVLTKLAHRAWPTMALAAVALLAALAVAIPAGVHAATHAGGWFDRATALVCFGLSAVPRYVMGMALIVIVGVHLGWLPFMGLSGVDAPENAPWGRLVDVLRHGVLIGVCFAYPLAAYLTRFVRDNVASVLSSDYIRTAYALGASRRRVLYRHALPNALLPLFTVLGLMIPAILSGAVILEVMFSWPGMGRLMYDAVMQRDYPVILGASAVTAVFVLVATLIVDLLYAVIDPRARCR
ncbi:MAG TPA: ABC transporter permease [Phycisphaerae bacterium]|nr:ABC transporter permease [Phycisphaerae bacterium]